MKLEFKKNDGKKHVITYHRDNGTKTWMLTDDFFIRHDLSHYAIEKTLGYKTAFYGMINCGVELEDFFNKEKRDAMKLTDEAAYAESMANLFLIDKFQGKIADFNATQQHACKTSFPHTAPLHLSAEQIEMVRNYLSDLLSKWKELLPNQILELEINL